MKKTIIFAFVAFALAMVGAFVSDMAANRKAAAATAGTCYFEASATSDGKPKFSLCENAKLPNFTFDATKCYVVSAGGQTAKAVEADCATLGTAPTTGTGDPDGNNLGLPQSSVKCEGTEEIGDCAKKTSFEFAGCGTDNVGIRCLVVEVLKFLSIGVGLAVVGGIAAGGIMYSTAEGNPSKTQAGVKLITNAVLGLVLYLLMFAILQFLIPGGVISAS